MSRSGISGQLATWLAEELTLDLTAGGIPKLNVDWSREGQGEAERILRRVANRRRQTL